MSFQMLDHTYNAVFIVPLLVGFLLILFQMMGFSLGKVLSGVETDADGHADADADAHMDADGDGLHHGLEAHAGAGGALFHALGFFNIGRVPFMVVLECLMLTFGGLGISMTALLGERLGGGAFLVLAASVPVALVGAVAVTKCLSAFFARYLPTLETTALSGHALVGLAGEVVSPRVDAEGGRCDVADRFGNRHTVHVRPAEGEPSMEKGERVLLLRYDGVQRVYQCARDTGASRT